MFRTCLAQRKMLLTKCSIGLSSLVLLNILLATSAAQCPEAPLIPNGHATYNYGVYAIYVCDPGYLMDDVDQISVVLLCNTSSGEWSGVLPDCNRIQCPHPAVPNFGSVEGSGRYYGDNITFSCETNYRLLDPTLTSVCTQYGSWSDETPECLPDLSSPDICPAGSWNYEDQTCFFANDNTITWGSARDTCASVTSGTPFGQLAKIPDQSTQDFIAVKLQGKTPFYWIGAFEGLKWYWEGSAVDVQYFSWADGEPNGPTDSRICIQLSGFSYPSLESHNYDWNDEDCSKASYDDSGKQNFFVCQHDGPCPVSDPDLNSYTQVPYGENNCAVFVKQQNSWDGSRSYCSSKAARLAEVTTEVQQQLLVSTANGEDDGSSPNWWIGGFRDDNLSNDELVWVDGPSVAEAFWYPDEPNEAGEKCVNLLSNENTFEWNDDICTSSYGYLCQYPGKRGPLQCSDPGTPPHGTSNASHADWLFGSDVTFSCDVGYELVGAERIDCRQNGSYSEVRPECKPISCNSPHPTLPNSYTHPVFTNEYQNVVVYICDDQYYPVGDVTSVCQSDGIWSQPTGSCVVNNTTPSPGMGSTATPSPGAGNTTVTSPGIRSTADPTLGTGNTTTLSSGTGTATTPSSGTGNTTTPSSGTGHATPPSSGQGNTTTVTMLPKTTVTHLPPASTPKNNDTITLQCSYFSMTVTIPLGLVRGVKSGDDLHLQSDVDCAGMISDDENFISITTNLTDCGNTIKEYDENIIYSNTVVERESTSPITRLPHVHVPFSCSYNRSAHIGISSYQITNYQLNSTEVSTGKYAFSLDIFKDEEFEEQYGDTEYPVDVNLNEDLYFGASVPSQDGTLDLSIRSCVATPSASYNDEQWSIIRDGCAVETSTHINGDALGFVAVTMNTFRFIDLGNRVYIHCDLLVCRATSGNETSECDPACVETSGNRARRDVIKEYSLGKKRITRGPLRLRRSSNLNPKLNDMIDFEKKPALGMTFNPWVVAFMSLTTLCVIIIVMLIVLLRKMTSYTRLMESATAGDEMGDPLLKT